MFLKNREYLQIFYFLKINSKKKEAMTKMEETYYFEDICSLLYYYLLPIKPNIPPMQFNQMWLTIV